LGTELVAIRLEDFAADLFQPLVGQRLSFRRPGNPPAERVEMELLQVRASRYGAPPGLRAPFSLLFTLRDTAPLDPIGLHRLDHPDFEPCDLLLTRVQVPELDRRDGTMFYEAVFG
jgi:hypothetical protein